MEAVFAVLTDAVIVYGRDGTVVRANPAAVAAFGADLVGIRREIVARKLAIRYRDGQPVGMADLPSSRALLGEQVVDEPLVVASAAGHDLRVLASASPLVVDGCRVGAVVVWHDVTERERVERAAEALREGFLSLAAHELKTPLTTLWGHVQILRRKGGHDAEEQHLFETMHAQANRMARLVRMLVEVSQLQSGALVLHLARTDLGELTRTAVQALRPASPRHRLVVSCVGPTVVEADPEHIREVLGNLLDNAVRYSPEGGLVEVLVRGDEHEVVVAVRDHGAGISEEKRVQLFAKFYQVSPMTHPTTGMGLGLYLSHEIVRLHGGRIWYEPGEHGGSVFGFSLPYGE